MKSILVCFAVVMFGSVANAQPKPVPPKPDLPLPAKPKPPRPPQEIVVGGIALKGVHRAPQLLYFLERVNEELERASLEQRSFIPHLVRTVEQEAL